MISILCKSEELAEVNIILVPKSVLLLRQYKLVAYGVVYSLSEMKCDKYALFDDCGDSHVSHMYFASFTCIDIYLRAVYAQQRTVIKRIVKF